MKKIAVFTLALLSLGTAAIAQGVYMQAPPPPPYGVASPPPPLCRPYRDVLSIGREKRITRGTACLQPDGSWALRPQNATVNYVARGGALYAVPAQPFVTEVIIAGHPHRRY